VWHGVCNTWIVDLQKEVYKVENLISGNLNISSLSDNSGRKYYTIRVAFSEKDILTIYKNSINELMDELPEIISSAIQARVVNELQTVN
jgi:ABC-type transporter lipoprotein component MlaA